MLKPASRSYKDISFFDIGAEAGKKSQNKLGSIPPKTGHYPVVLESGQVVSQLLSFLLKHLNAGSIYEKLSLLEGSLGKKRLSKLFTLQDNPFASWGFYSCPFDSEGYPSQKTSLVEEGVIKNYLASSELAKKINCPHTAKASRGDKAKVLAQETNLVMQAGSTAFKDLCKLSPKLILVDHLKGLAGYNPISGDFSIESEGFLLENGEPVQALSQFHFVWEFALGFF